MQGKIINITRYCLNDGKGIRTTVFLKGCPLSCIWCHNPESQNIDLEISYDKRKCMFCGACQSVCIKNCHNLKHGIHVFDRTSCITCFKCVNVCAYGSLHIEGKVVTIEEVVKEIEKDKPFYDFSDGGVTISGGEPLFQPEFTYGILKACKEKGISTAIETCGFSSENVFKKCIKYCDNVIFDLKETDKLRHVEYTGKPLKPILNNLKILGNSGIKFTLRLPVIPNLNDREDHFLKAKELVADFKNLEKIEKMTYHELGVYKYELLGREYLYKHNKQNETY